MVYLSEVGSRVMRVVAAESASMTLLGGELPGLVEARALSKAAMKNIRQNLLRVTRL